MIITQRSHPASLALIAFLVDVCSDLARPCYDGCHGYVSSGQLIM